MKKTVLIVDDENELAELTAFFLEDQGFLTEIKNSAVDAIEVLKTKSFEYVITDIRMPRMSGIELVKHINQNIENPPKIIMASGYDESIDRNSNDLNVLAVLNKPYNFEDLLKYLKA